MVARSSVFAVSAAIMALVSGCAATTQAPPPEPTVAQPEPVPQGAPLDAFFAKYDAAVLSLSPQEKAFRGIRDADYGRWDRNDDKVRVTRETLLQATADAMRKAYDPATLTPEQQLSYTLFDAMAKRSAATFPYRRNRYLFDQMNGAQSELPAFLINVHRVSNAAEAAAYIERIAAIGPTLDELSVESAIRAERGAAPPKWVYTYVINDIDALMSGATVIDDFTQKLAKVPDLAAEKDTLVARARTAWAEHAVPAYARLRTEMVRQQAAAGTQDGVWRMPDGAAYYQALLSDYTTTNMTADEIHNLGLREVARIHGEMRAIMQRVGFKGTLQQFFTKLRNDPKMFAPTREAYLKQVDDRLATMTARLPEFFGTLPKAPLQIKPVEAFREKSAGKAFYSSPAPDGSRPGIYYVNLHNLRDMSLTELEALAYHEGVPGHHLQLAIQSALGDLPPFRQFGDVTAYSEGWGLYSETLAKEMGAYTDPYSDFGRLGMELWRACRLVTDTGLHSKRWSREQAIAYLTANTPNPPGDIRKAIERYIVYPGQATAYTVGKIKIMELRESAKARLGARFDIRRFHDMLLRNGPVPLDVLAQETDRWIQSESTRGN